MGNASIDEHGIADAGIDECAVAGMYFYIWIAGQILAGAGCQIRIHFTGDHAPAGSYHFSQDRRVIAHTTSQMKNALTGFQIAATTVGWVCPTWGTLLYTSR